MAKDCLCHRHVLSDASKVEVQFETPSSDAFAGFRVVLRV